MKSRLSEKKKIVVTGGLGFIGSHFVETMLRLGHHVVNIDKCTYAANLDLGFDKAWPNYEFRMADISTLTELPLCDILVNFAAESHVDNSISSSHEFLNSNVLGTYRLLEIIKNNKLHNMQMAWENKTPLFVQISTDEVFGDIEDGFFAENDRHKPSNPYAATKSAAEQIVVAWSRTYEIPYIITRTTNNYGPRQHHEKLIPKTVTRLLQNKKVPVHGNGQYVRNWIHVEDNVSALRTIIEFGDTNQSYHISSDDEVSVKEIVGLIAGKFSKTFEQVADMSTDRSGADVRYALDSSKTRALGWKVEHTLESSLDSIIDCCKRRDLK